MSLASLRTAPQTNVSGEVSGRPASSKPAINYHLQYLRAIAAISVVLCHASYYLMAARGDSWLWNIFARAGLFGVMLFFAISGYLMAQLAPGSTSLRFMAHRLIRIYPPYWLAVFLVVVVNRGAIQPILAALVLSPGTTTYVLGVEWTLPFELTFYLIVCGVIALRAQRWLPWIGLSWIFAILAGVLLWPGLQQGQFPLLLNLPMSTFCLPFAGGLIIPTALRRRWVGPASPVLGLCAVAANEAMPNAVVGFALMTLGCVLLVAAAARPQGPLNAPPPNFALAALGDWSYALYLIHVPIMRAMDATLPATTPLLAQWSATVAAPIACAVVFGKIDLRLYRILKRRVDQAGAPVLLGLAGAFVAAMAIFGGAGQWRAIEAWRTSERLAPVAAHVVAALAQDKSDLASAAEHIGLTRDPSLLGYIDNVAERPPREQFIQGWAGDSGPSARPVDVLMFQCGAFVGAAPAEGNRPEVGKALGVSRQDFGFSATFSKQLCSQDRPAALILTRDRHYGLVTPPAPRQ
jgi:exopolysaccharide production protein ExoZ